VHPEIFYFTELRPQDRELLTGFADHAKKINQAATLHLFGSRIDGRWREDSDYDIMIKGVDSKEEQEKIRAYKSDARLDLRFITGEIKAHTVEIK